MFSLQEIGQNDQIKNNLHATQDYMDKHGYYDPAVCNIYRGLKRSMQRELSETLRRLSLAQLLRYAKTGSIKEYATSTTATTGSLGAAGINYLVPAWITSNLAVCIDTIDIAPKVAGFYIPSQSGETVQFNNIARAIVQKAVGATSAGNITVHGGEAKSIRYAAPIIITNEMLEDNQYDLLQPAIQASMQQLIQQSNDQILETFARSTGALGYGSKQTAAAGADTTTPANLATITAQVGSYVAGVGTWKPDLLIATVEAWWDALATTAGHPEIAPGVNGYDAWYGGLNTVIVQTASSSMGTFASNRLTNAVTIVACKAAALGVARKNWMRIENYSDPVKDLAGAVLSGRQATAELVDAAIGVLTEA